MAYYSRDQLPAAVRKDDAIGRASLGARRGRVAANNEGELTDARLDTGLTRQ
jgi:hypothetical protein